MPNLGSYYKFYIIFTIFGFYEINFVKFRKIFYFVNWSIVCIIILYVIFKLNTIISLISPVSSFNDIIQMLSITVSVIGISIQSIRRRKSYRKIIKNFQHLDNLFDENLFRKSRDYTVRFCVAVAFTIVVESNTFIEVRIKEAEWARFWILNIYQLTITRLWYLNHVMHMNFIAKRLELINKNLEKILQRSRKHDNANRLRYEMRKIKTAYRLAWNSMWHLNKIFGFTQMLNFGQCFIEFVAEFYWIYLYWFYEPKPIYATAYVWTPTLLYIYLLLSEANKIELIQSALLSNVNKIHFLRDNRWLVKLSYQMMSNKIYFHAGNFFAIDFDLVKSMVTSLSVYLVITIQFIPKND